jgi:hypothetical protein
VDEFRLDPDLHETLKGIRSSVRKLFEQLRVRHESGDTSGKERLDRVPALSRRNFGRLSGPSHLANKEAWRLLDFLEGEGDPGLSAVAREGLRVVELDKKLAALRASNPAKGRPAMGRPPSRTGPAATPALPLPRFCRIPRSSASPASRMRDP